jgi:hypothetical protein
MTRQEKIDKASTEWDKAYAIFHKADFEYTEIVAKATDDPEPQADRLTIDQIQALINCDMHACKPGYPCVLDPGDGESFTKCYGVWSDKAFKELLGIRQSKAEPQADDVETIRNAIEKGREWHDCGLDENGGVCDDHRDRILKTYDDALAALSRLSAPVDVQARAEAVVDAFCDDYVNLHPINKQELSRLIVEQFTRKG